MSKGRSVPRTTLSAPTRATRYLSKNADYLDWTSFGHAIAQHVRHRNSHDERILRAENRKLIAA